MSDVKDKFDVRNETERSRDILEEEYKEVALKHTLLWAAKKVGSESHLGIGLKIIGDGVSKTVVLKGLKSVGPKAMASGKILLKAGGPTVTALEAFLDSGDLNPGEDDQVFHELALSKMTPEQRRALEQLENSKGPASVALLHKELQASADKFNREAEMQLQVDDLRREYDIKYNEVSAAKRAQRQHGIEDMHLSDELQMVKNNRTESEQKLSMLVVFKAEADEKVQTNSQQLQQLEQQKQAFTVKYQQLTAEINRLNNVISNLREKQQSCQNTLNALEQSLRGNQGELINLKQQIRTFFYCTGEHHTFEQMLAGQCGNLNSCPGNKVQEARNLVARARAVEKELVQQDAQIAAKRTEFNSIVGNLNREQITLANAERNLAQQQTEQASVEAEIKYKHEELAAATQIQLNLQQEIAEEKLLIETLVGKEVNLQFDIDSISKKIANIENDIIQKELELQIAKEALQSGKHMQALRQSLDEPVTLRDGSLRFNP